MIFLLIKKLKIIISINFYQGPDPGSEIRIRIKRMRIRNTDVQGTRLRRFPNVFSETFVSFEAFCQMSITI